MDDEHDEPDEILGFDRRKALLAIGLAVLLAVAAFGLVGRFANYDKLLHAVERSSKPWLPVGLLGELIAYTGYVLAYRCVARVDDGPRLGYWTVVRIVGLGFGAFVVASSAGGLAVAFWSLKRAGLKAHASARRVLALNTLEWAVLGWMATVAAAIVLALRQGDAPLAMVFAWLVVVPACTLGGYVVTQPARYERLVQPPGDHTGRLVGKARRLFGDAVAGVGLVREIVSQPRRYAAGVAGFPLYWLGDLLALYAGVRAFGGHVGPAALVLAYTTGYVLTALPLPAGGAGSMETVLAFTLHAVGVPLAPALLGAFLYRAFAFWLPIVPAVALLPSVPSLNDELAPG